jgi:L-cysteine desulfidase
METTDIRYQTYVEILKQELVPAMGCTEPIAVAYCGAKAREALGELPRKVEIYASGNIIKNVKSVIVPNTGGLKGLEAAAAAGILYGKADRELEVIADITPEQKDSLKDAMNQMKFHVEPLESGHILDMEIRLTSGEHTSSVRIWDTHTNIVEIKKDEKVIFQNMAQDAATEGQAEEEPDYDLLKVPDIFEFANTVQLSDVSEILERQISYNTAISEAGMSGKYGASIGQVLAAGGNDIKIRAKAAAAAASDARMGGCELPVVINSGSGNQGITASLPVIVYARHYEKTEEELLRALVFSNLITLHLKSGIGRLSAYCGAVSAGVGAGAGIAYLLTGDLRTINHTIVNAVAITSGIVCDGAKASCAAKIAMAVEAGILGFEMFLAGSQFRAGDGLVGKGVEKTIHNIYQLGHDGMLETDRKIIQIMTECMEE